MAAKPPAVKKTAATSLVSWKDKLKSYATSDAATADDSGIGGGFKLSAKKGKLYYDGQPVSGNALDIVILDSVMENAYYDREFDPDNPRSPVCFALGRTKDDMVPHPDSAIPQSKTCEECSLNQFGSADKGRGKACKNVRRFAALPAIPLEPEVLRAAELAYMKTSVTSSKPLNNYIKRLKNTYDLPTMAFVTRLTCVDDEKNQFMLTFHDQARLDDNDEIMGALVARREELADEIMFPYAPPPDDEPLKSKARGNKKY